MALALALACLLLSKQLLYRQATRHSGSRRGSAVGESSGKDGGVAAKRGRGVSKGSSSARGVEVAEGLASDQFVHCATLLLKILINKSLTPSPPSFSLRLLHSLAHASWPQLSQCQRCQPNCRDFIQFVAATATSAATQAATNVATCCPNCFRSQIEHTHTDTHTRRHTQPSPQPQPVQNAHKKLDCLLPALLAPCRCHCSKALSIRCGIYLTPTQHASLLTPPPPPIDYVSCDCALCAQCTIVVCMRKSRLMAFYIIRRLMPLLPVLPTAAKWAEASGRGVSSASDCVCESLRAASGQAPFRF